MFEDQWQEEDLLHWSQHGHHHLPRHVQQQHHGDEQDQGGPAPGPGGGALHHEVSTEAPGSSCLAEMVCSGL